MGIEQEQMGKVSKDIYQKIREDRVLSDDEKQDIIQKYEGEKSHITSETQSQVGELKDFLEIFQESLILSEEQIREIQKILKFQEQDGKFGPNTFQKFIGYRKENNYTGTLMQLIHPGREDTGVNSPTQENLEKDTLGEVLSVGESPVKEDTGEISSDELKKKLGDEARQYPKSLIVQLQKKLDGISADGSFGKKSIERLFQVFPEVESMQDAFDRAKIDTDIDDVLVGPNATAQEAKERFRALYGELIGVLGNNLDLPNGLIDSIVSVETTYGKNLGSETGSKGLMQLTKSPFEDMSQDAHRVAKYTPIYQDLDISTLLNIQIDGKTVEQRMPENIVEAFKILNNPETSVRDFQSQIQILQTHLKGKGSGHDHEANLIVGAVYLAYQYRRHNGDIYKASRDYNGEANGRNERYARNVIGKITQFNKEEQVS